MATRFRGRRVVTDQYQDGDWDGLRVVIRKMIDLIHDSLGYNTDTPGILMAQMLPEADANTNGLLSKELWRVVNHIYDMQVDTTSTASTWYVGLAARGSATSASVWRIKKVVYDGTSRITQTLADGNTAFDNIWDNRLALTYS